MSAIRRLVLSVLQPFTEAVGKVHAPFAHKLVKYGDVMDVRALVKPGDILVSVTLGEASNVPIPGFWSHAAMATGKTSVLEMTGKGLIESRLESFLMTKDYFALLSPKFANDVQRAAAVKWLYQREGRVAYDYGMEIGGDEMYCSEACYRAYAETMACPLKPQHDIFGVPVVPPQQLFDAEEHFLRLIVRAES